MRRRGLTCRRIVQYIFTMHEPFQHTRSLRSPVGLAGCLAFLGLLLAAGSFTPAAARANGVYADDADSLFAIAGELYAQRRYDEAIPLFQRVIDLRPRHGNAHALLGGSFLQLGDYPSAIASFERALQLDEGIKLAYLGLVAANYFTERVEAAERWLARMVPILSGDERDRYLAMLTTQFPRLSPPGS